MAEIRDQLRYVGVTIGVFVVIGIAFGVTGYFGMSFVQDQFVDPLADGGGIGDLFVDVVFVQAVFITLFAAPLVGGLVGLTAGYTIGDPRTAAVTSAVGSFVGVSAMFVISIAVLSMGLAGTADPAGIQFAYGTDGIVFELAGPDGEGGSERTIGLASLLLTVIKSAIPTTLLAGITGALGSVYADG